MAERDQSGPNRTRARARSAVFAGVLLAVIGGQMTAAAAQDAGPAAVLRVEADPGTHLVLDERGRYAGALELRAAAPGVVVNELGIEDYLAGVDEMPSRWHLEALQAQAVAARTYAWYSIGLGSFDGYDICATTSCQVYRGIGAIEDGDGERWLEAVERTSGEVLLDEDGEPILARYFSTSGGQTVPNEVAFPSSGPRPYLTGTDDPFDAASPYHRWTARFTRDEFDRVLARGDTLAAAVPVADVERLGDTDDPGAEVRVTGQDGTSVDVGARELREFLSRLAPESFPDRFPGPRADGFRSLPTTVPSSRFDAEVTDDEVILHGRGWGHAVGLGQYGALGRAQDGQDYRQILAAYYAGLEPTTSDELPDSIRVGIESPGPHTIRGGGVFRVLVDGEVALDRAIGTWTASHDGAGWTLTAPAGHDAALEVAPTRVTSAATSVAGAVTVETEVNKPALLRLEVADDTGEVVVTRDLGAVDAGSHVTTWRSVDAEGEPFPAGEYRVALIAEDAAGATAGSPVVVTVDTTGDAATDAGDLEAAPEPGGAASTPLIVFVAGVALLAAIIVLGSSSRRRST